MSEIPEESSNKDSDKEEDKEEELEGETTNALPAPKGLVVKHMHTTKPQEQKEQVCQMFELFANVAPNLIQLNEIIQAFVALVCLPASSKIKALYRLSSGCSGISKTAVTVGKLLVLTRE
eukprot:15365215-Ditylum_brightwellii.AAC.1